MYMNPIVDLQACYEVIEHLLEIDKRRKAGGTFWDAKSAMMDQEINLMQNVDMRSVKLQKQIQLQQYFENTRNAQADKMLAQLNEQEASESPGSIM